jgi:hypothetical protein
VSIEYNPDLVWDRKSWNFGASLTAFDNLLNKYNYKLVVTSNGTNAFWINDNDIVRFDISVPSKKSVFTKLNRNRSFTNKHWIKVN